MHMTNKSRQQRRAAFPRGFPRHSSIAAAALLSLGFLPLYSVAGAVIADGTRVSYWSGDQPNIVFFQFSAQGHTNTYRLDCSSRRFLWVKNVTNSTGLQTNNNAGAEWRDLHSGSNKANAVFSEACDSGSAMASRPPNGVGASPGAVSNREKMYAKFYINRVKERCGGLNSFSAMQVQIESSYSMLNEGLKALRGEGSEITRMLNDPAAYAEEYGGPYMQGWADADADVARFGCNSVAIGARLEQMASIARAR
jgi:hypothetical protein